MATLTKAKKPLAKIDFKHFKLEFSPFAFEKESWDFYYKLAGKPKLEGEEKEELKSIRSEFGKALYELKLTHIKSGISRTWEVENRSLFKNKAQCVIYAKEVLAEVAKERKKREAIVGTQANFFGANYIKVGGVFSKPGQILEIGKNSDFNNPLIEKRPMSKTKNYIGVELEFLPHATKETSINIIAKLMRENNLGKIVQVVTDSSCGYEVKVLLTDDDFIEPLTKVLKVLRDAGYKVDGRCGTHVHLDMRNRDVKTVYRNLFMTQSFLRKFIARDRKKNQYCEKNSNNTFDEEVKQKHRRRGINATAFDKHKTIEIRMHHGTLSSAVLIPWIKLLLKVVTYTGQLEKGVNSLKQAKQVYSFDGELTSLLTKRLLSVFRGETRV